MHSGEPHKLGRPGATPGPAIRQAVGGRSLGRRQKTLQSKPLKPKNLARSRGPAANVSLRVKPASELRVENRPAGSDLGGLRARWSAGGTQHVKSNIYGSNQRNRKPVS